MRLFDWIPLGKVPELTADDLFRQREEVQIVDVRTLAEYRSNHIAGARHLALATFTESNIAALNLDPSRPVVTICLSAHRSIPATRKLRALGFDTRQLSGGMKAWWARNLPTTSA